jgi:ATP-dependent DNA helicase DinG
MLSSEEQKLIRDTYKKIARSVAHFRPREAQRKMLAKIAHSLGKVPATDLEAIKDKEDPGEDNHPESPLLVIEAPTGIGKSLAYLISGLILALSRKKTLVVSSATIALQEQLVHRDIPHLLKHSGLNINYQLAKGRGRYMCPYRLYQLSHRETQQSELFSFYDATWDRRPAREDILVLEKWAQAFQNNLWDGDRDSWPEHIPDDLWRTVTNDRHGCLKAVCPNRQECPFFIAREALEEADLIITNHDLLLADLSMGGGVLLSHPKNSMYCIDEAHHLPKKSLGQFASEHYLFSTISILEKLPNWLHKYLSRHKEAEHLVSQATEASLACIEHLKAWEMLILHSDTFSHDTNDEHATWVFDAGLPEELKLLAHNMHIASQTLLNHLNKCSELSALLRKNNTEHTTIIDLHLSELGVWIGRMENIVAVWDLFTKDEEKESPTSPPTAKWIARTHARYRQDQLDFVFAASPVNAAHYLDQYFWRKASGIVLTSATLRALGSFDWFLLQTGLYQHQREVECIALNTPFCHAEQAELYIPQLNIDPKNHEEHTQFIINQLPLLIDPQEPMGSLVLFSSKRQLEQVFNKLPQEWQDMILCQGSYSKNNIVQKHREYIEKQQKASIIFGLESFAEGLDLPGDLCTHVVITKLPFATPDDPVGKTLAQWIKKRGGNPFMEMTIPDASIKLIQATGRLLRSEQDYGRITILDDRILTKRYGKSLISALPNFKRIY